MVFSLVFKFLLIRSCLLSLEFIELIFFFLQKNLQCPDCPKRIPMASVLKFHRELEHGLKASVCNLCGKTVTKMKQHMLFVHTSEKQLQCDKCEFRTNNKSNLKRHMIRHSDDPMAGRKCVCEICHKAFYTK